MNSKPRTCRSRAFRVAARQLFWAALVAAATAASAGGIDTHAAALGTALPVIGISSHDLEFMLRAARICNGRTAVAKLVVARSSDHAARKFARGMLIDYQEVNRRLHALAGTRGIALPSGTTRQMADVTIALRGVPDDQVEEAFFRRVGIDAEGDAAALFGHEAADPHAWPPLRALAQSALAGVRARIEVATALHSARQAGALPPGPAMLIPTPG